MTPKQITEIFNATRPFTYQEFGRRVAAAARAEAIEECARVADNDGSVAGDAIAEDIRALLNTANAAGAKKQDVGCLCCGGTNVPHAATAANGRYVCAHCATAAT